MTTAKSQDFKPSELDDQVAPSALSTEDLQAIALEAGMPNSTWSFPPELHAYTLLIVERCAAIGDRYTERDSDANAGEEIRAAFGLG